MSISSLLFKTYFVLHWQLNILCHKSPSLFCINFLHLQFFPIPLRIVINFLFFCFKYYFSFLCYRLFCILLFWKKKKDACTPCKPYYFCIYFSFSTLRQADILANIKGNIYLNKAPEKNLTQFPLKLTGAHNM